MKTHNLVIYHCLSCGAVMHSEPEDVVPECCGRAMVKSAAETIRVDDGRTVEEEVRTSADGHLRIDRYHHRPR